MDSDRWLKVDPVVFQGRGYTPKKNSIFVIMPFSPKWSSKVWRVIKEETNRLGYNTIRSDEQYGHQVLEDIWKGICEASIVIADVTGRNPNVFYELGIAHVLGRRVLLLAQDVHDIPFDTRIYRHILYNMPFLPWAQRWELSTLSTNLNKTIAWITENEIPPSEGSIAEAYTFLQTSKSHRSTF